MKRSNKTKNVLLMQINVIYIFAVFCLMGCNKILVEPTVVSAVSTIQGLKTDTPTTATATTPTSLRLPTKTPKKISLSYCKITTEEGKLYALSDDIIFSWESRGEQIDTALEDNFPEWAAYRQTVEWAANPVKISEVVINASWQEQFVLNPRVTLVTLGESFNWQLPADRDLYLESKVINESLNHLWFEWTNPGNDEIRSLYPDISNASTYALYIYFDKTAQKLEHWCNSYQKLFETTPLHP